MPVVVAIEGNIACGKTTYIERQALRLRARGYRVVIVKEPVDKWETSGILTEFYKNKKEWAYKFQTIAFLDRIEECIKQFEAHGNDVDIYILERSCFSDNLFMDLLYEEGNVTDIEMSMYRQWCSMWWRLMPFKPDVFVYLNTSVEECMVRRTKRNRNGECDIPQEYFEALAAKHDDFLMHGDVDTHDGDTAPVHVVNIEKDYRESPQEDILVEQFVGIVSAVSA